ncbi:hypothetical protein [Variovorax rhizosphaerae]|uniref:TnsA endonuclease N-terminal domain-containing protein n=1 Tax=Variovorax rhizosphaerae TaxID=1836200 RepID=A0ABU8WTG3_9BURK
MKQSRIGSRIGTQMRGQFEELYARRGGKTAYITVTYSMKAAIDVGLLGRTNYLNYLACEGDPLIERVQYKPQRCLAEVGVTAAVVTRQRILQLRVVRAKRIDTEKLSPLLDHYAEQFRQKALRSPCAFDDVEILSLGSQDLVTGHEVALRNWHELVPWVAQARFHRLERLEQLFADLLVTRGQLTTGQVMALALQMEESPALLMAAAIRGVACGRWMSDFDIAPFGAHSVFRLGASQ